MKAVYFPEVGTVDVREVPEPTIVDPTDVVVQIEASSICGSDLHIVQGDMVSTPGFTIGHEYIGTIIAVGAAVVRFRPGDRVVGPPAPWCGTCAHCRRGQIQRCERGGVLGSGDFWGGFGGTQSQILRVPFADHDLTLIPQGVTDVQALSLSDAVPTGWTGVLKAGVQAGDVVVVLGAGPVGLGAVHTAKRLTGATRVIAVDTVASRLEVAKRLGADHIVVPGPDTVGELKALTGGRGADVIVDCAGVQQTFDTAVGALAPGGRISILGVPSKTFSFDVANLLLQNGDARIWIGLGDVSQGERLMRAVASGDLDPTPMWTHEVALDEVPALYARLFAGDSTIIKVLVRP